MEGHRVRLTEVNPYLVCVLCHGYLVDATTIAECLHSFCRSCIFRQLERKSICPICETHVHNTKLYRSLRPDKTLQDIVYKLVPGLFHNEMQRRRDFYKNHPFRDEHLEPECRGVGLDRLIYSPDDQISLSLEFYDDEREKEEWSNHSSPKPAQIAPSGPKRYLQCPAGFKMLHLKKFLRQKYGLSSSCNVEIMYRRECLPDSYSLMDVAYIYTWKRNSPMRFYYRMPEVVMKQLTATPPEVPLIEKNEVEKKNKGKETVPHSPEKNSQKKLEESEVENKNEKTEITKAVIPEKKSLPKKETGEGEKKEVKPKDEEVAQQGSGDGKVSSPRPLSKQDELSVSVLLSLGQCRVGSKDDHKFLMPLPVTPKNGITEKRNGKVSPKPSVNKIASDLAEHKAQQPRVQVPIPETSQNQTAPQSQPSENSAQQKPHHLQQLQQQKQHHKQQLKSQQLHQQKHQQLLQQKQQQMQQLIQQHHHQKLQQQFQQQQHLIQQQQLQQIHLQQVQRQQLQQIQAQQSPVVLPGVQIQQQQLQQVVQQVKETKPLEQQPLHQAVQQQQPSDQSLVVSNPIQQVTNHPSQMLKTPQIAPALQHSQLLPSGQQQQPTVQPQPGQQPQPQQQNSPQQKKWPEPAVPENPQLNGSTNVQNPQVTLNTSNGSVTIMAQLKSASLVPVSLGVTAGGPGSPAPTVNGKLPDTPRPQGIHQNLPRTVLPKTPFANGKPIQKPIQQKNLSGQRLNNNLPEGKNGLIQQSNINNRLPTFQKNGGAARKTGIPGGVISKTGPTLDQRIQQLYNSGQTNKPPSPGGKSESRLANWLNNRFKAPPAKDEPDSAPPSPQTAKEANMQRYKRKLQEMQKVQEICEITQENPKPDDAKRRREVTPDVSIELMRAADMKKLDSTKKEKRPMPGLKSIQEVGAKRKKEEDSALDLSKPGDLLRPQLPWLMSRPPHFIPRPT